MDKESFSPQEGALMIQALNALISCNPSDYAIGRAKALQSRIAAGNPFFSTGEIKNICLGLELVLEDDPMNWSASQLLSRLRNFLVSTGIKPDTIH